MFNSFWNIQHFGPSDLRVAGLVLSDTHSFGIYMADSDPTGSAGHSVDHEPAPTTDNSPWELSVGFWSVGLGLVKIDLVDYTTGSELEGLVLSSGVPDVAESC